jgi:hypothetical protein
VGRGGTELHRQRAIRDGVEALDPSQPDDPAEVAHLLGDPQADIGRAGDQYGIGILRIECRQRLDAGRGGEEPLGRTREQVDTVIEARKRAGDLGLLAGEAVAPVPGTRRKPGIHDGAIAGAAAQIPGDPVIHLVAGDGAATAIMKQRKQRHHEAGRAEAALRSVQVHHRLLHRMQAAGREVVDTDDFAAVSLPGQQDAGIDGAVHQPIIDQPSEHHRAGPAIAFGTSFLGAHGALGQSQIVQQGQRRGGIVEANDATPAQELNVTSHGPTGASGKAEIDVPPIRTSAEGGEKSCICPSA